MGQIHIGKGIRFLLNNRSYEIDSEIEKDTYMAFDIEHSRVKQKFTRGQLAESLQEGKLIFSERGKNTTGELVKKYAFDDFSMLPKELQESALYRFEAIKPLINLNVVSMSPYIDARRMELMEEGIEISKASFYRWLNDYHASHNDIRSLISSEYRSGNPGKRIFKEVEMIINNFIDQYYLAKERRTVKTIFELISHQINTENKNRTPEDQLKLPSESTVLRRIKERDEFEVTKAREGTKNAWQKHGQINPFEKPSYPLQRVEADHTRLDLFVVDDETRLPIGRPTITSILDVFTGYPLGIYIGFEPPSYTAVMHALNHAIFPKSYVKKTYPKFKNDWVAHGLPEVLVVDNGKEFLSKHLVHACNQLQIELVHCPVKKPWYKGAVERYFRTINQSLLHQTKGTTFSNIIDKGEYDPEKNAVIGFNQLLEYFHKWVVDYYAIGFNKGVKGVPIKLWERAFDCIPSPALPSSSIDWKIALMKVEKGSIQRSGIRFKHLFFQSESFVKLLHEIKVRGEKNSFKFKYNPTDMSKIFVYDPFDHSYIEVFCSDQKYTEGLNEYTHNVIIGKLNEEAKNVDREALAEARYELEQMVGNEINLTLTERRNNRRMEGKGSNKVWAEEGKSATEKELDTKLKPEAELGLETEPKAKPVVKLASEAEQKEESEGKTIPETRSLRLPRVKEEEKVVSIFRDIDEDDWRIMNAE